MSCHIYLPDGNYKSFESCPTGLEVAQSISPGLAKKAVAVIINKDPELKDIRSPLQHKDRVEIVTLPSEKSLEVIRHSSAHVMAQAVQNLWPEVKVTIGPVIKNGFYYDFDTDKKFTPEDLSEIEKEMQKILTQKYELKKEVWSSEKAGDYFEKKGEILKKEIIEDLQIKEVSVYQQGNWLDLCKGPHVQHLGQIGVVKVLSQSGAYWRGDPSNRQLQRIYGTAFHNQKQLKAFLEKQEAAKQNDHRVLGKKLNLFWFSDLSPGQPFFTPLGTTVYQKLQNFLREKYRQYNYQEVISPQIYRSDLFEQSGHIQHFSENMYAISHDLDSIDSKKGVEGIKQEILSLLKKHPEGLGPKAISEKVGLPRQIPNSEGQNDRLAQYFLDYLKGEGLIDNPERGKWKYKEKLSQKNPSPEDENSSFFLKPMNCPGHCLLYKKERKSYRDLPYRLADFGRLHRNEPAGSLQGLTRVRAFCQDDAHIFCRLDQLSQEIQEGIKMLQEIYKTLGLEDYKIELSTRPEDRMGADKLWDQAEQALSSALEKLNIPYEIQAGEGAFYGPKLDVAVQDSFDRAWQLGTFQCDFNLPQAFDLSYVNKEDKEEKPVMLHRAILGSLERFMGIYLEHSTGRLASWLAPVPVIILPLTDRELEFSKKIQKKLEKKEILCNIDSRNEKLSYKIRESQTQQIPYMLVIGKKEVDSQSISVRLRTGEQISGLKPENFIEGLVEEISQRRASSFLTKPGSAY